MESILRLLQNSCIETTESVSSKKEKLMKETNDDGGI